MLPFCTYCHVMLQKHENGAAPAGGFQRTSALTAAILCFISLPIYGSRYMFECRIAREIPAEEMLKLTFARGDKNLLGVSIIIFLFSVLLVVPALSQQSSTPRAYLGFDRNDYPGDAALLALRRSFSFAGYWLGPPPGAKSNSCSGKRELVRSLGFGFLVLYGGPQSNELQQKWSEQHVFNNLKTRLSSAWKRGASDARQATAAAKKEGFPSHTVIFLDIEEGGRLPAVYHAYLRSWVDQLERAGYRAGVYCSGMPVDEGGGVTSLLPMTSARTLVSAASSTGSTTMPALPRRDARRRKIRFLHPPADCLTPPPGNSRNRHVANNSPLVVPPPIPPTAIATLLVILRILGISTSIPRIHPTRRMADDVVTKKRGRHLAAPSIPAGAASRIRFVPFRRPR